VTIQLNKIYLKWIALAVLVTGSIGHANSQDNSTNRADSLFDNQLAFDSLLLDEMLQDSASFISLIQDILDQDYLHSQLTLRLGYTSDILNAGRNFGVSQFGLSAGVSYYHKSGVFADISGYYNSDLQPKYNTTVISAGYMGSIGKQWSYILSYDHFFYRQQTNTDFPIEYPLTNSANGSMYIQLKKWSLGFDYSFLFGSETAHRIRNNISYSFSLGKLKKIDRIAFTPNLSLLLGNANITTTVFNRETAKAKAQELIDQIGRANFLYLFYNERERLKELLSEIKTTNSFGVMNYSLYLPLSVTIKQTTFLVSYSLNFPVALPGEEGVDTSVNGYLSASILFNFSLK